LDRLSRRTSLGECESPSSLIYPIGNQHQQVPPVTRYRSHAHALILIDHRAWICWAQLIFGVVAQVVHLLIVPETRTSILLDREAKRRRLSEPSGSLQHKGKTIPNSTIYGPNELTSFKERFAPRKVLKTWYRPFQMFFTEPIVLCCSLLSGFSDSLIFTFLEAFTPVYEQWGFKGTLMVWTFIP
jgi:hypothetical protein